MPMKYHIWSPSSNQTPSSLLERCERRVSGALKPDSFGLVGSLVIYGIPQKLPSQQAMLESVNNS